MAFEKLRTIVRKAIPKGGDVLTSYRYSQCMRLYTREP